MNNNYLKLQFKKKKSALFLVSPPDGSKVSWVRFRESSFIVKKNHDFTRKKKILQSTRISILIHKTLTVTNCIVWETNAGLYSLVSAG